MNKTHRADIATVLLDPTERLRLIEENVRDYAIFTVTPEGHIASWNIGAERILGYTEAEIHGQRCNLIFTPEDQAQGEPEKERATAAATGRAEDERWHVRKDGSRFYASGIMTALYEGDTLRGFAKILRDFTDRKKAEAMQQQWEREITLHNERNRMAQELHDTLAQSFVGIKLQTELAQELLTTELEAAKHHLARIQEIAVQAMEEARLAIRALRLPLLQEGDLSQALENLAKQATDGVTVTFHLEGVLPVLPEEVESDFYRIAQEAVTNALKYARAKTIDLSLLCSEAELILRIEDNGQGFDPHAATLGFGVRGMRERAERLGAELTLMSEVGKGTRISLLLRKSEQRNRD